MTKQNASTIDRFLSYLILVKYLKKSCTLVSKLFWIQNKLCISCNSDLERNTFLSIIESIRSNLDKKDILMISLKRRTQQKNKNCIIISHKIKQETTLLQFFPRKQFKHPKSQQIWTTYEIRSENRAREHTMLSMVGRTRRSHLHYLCKM